jgi:hypothetical protein
MTFPSAGSIAFVGFNADGGDSFAFLAVDGIPAGTTIYFRDDEWDGSAFSGNGESRIAWTTATAVQPGTIVQIDNIFGSTTGTQPLPASTGTATITTNNLGGRGLNATAEELYAYVGTDADTPSTFLAAIATDGFGDGQGVLTGTGLVAGTTALELGAGAGSPDVAVYGAEVAQTDFGTDRALALSTINNPANWLTQDATGDQSNDGIGPEGDFLGDPESPLNGATFAICFWPGTRIATPAGEAPIESLRPGDLVLTAEGEAVPVRWLWRQTIAQGAADPDRAHPVRIASGALGGGLPRRDLRVSPRHAIRLGAVLAEAGALANGGSIRAEHEAGPLVWYTIELDAHRLILAEGVAAESFLDHVPRRMFDGWDAYLAAGGEDREIAEMALPRVQSARQAALAAA